MLFHLFRVINSQMAFSFLRGLLTFLFYNVRNYNIYNMLFQSVIYVLVCCPLTQKHVSCKLQMSIFCIYVRGLNYLLSVFTKHQCTKSFSLSV